MNCQTLLPPTGIVVLTAHPNIVMQPQSCGVACDITLIGDMRVGTSSSADRGLYSGSRP